MRKVHGSDIVLRWTLLLFAATLCISTGAGPAEAVGGAEKPPKSTGTIVALGDSLTAAYGLPEDAGYPARLEKRLNDAGLDYRVVNAGVSGETSSGALSRIKWILSMKPDIVILETGANDGLRGIPTDLMQRNIDDAVKAIQESGATVVLAGMKMLRNMGREYTDRFEAAYTAVAKARGVILMPFFLEGVAGDPNLNQEDGIHPTAKGYAIITENIYPYVVKAIGERASGRRAALPKETKPSE
ncbi:MAG: arylesterase [Syntrophobacteraceae bacterium]